MSFPHKQYFETVRAARLDARLDVEADILDFKEDAQKRDMVYLKLRFRSRTDAADFADGGTAIQRDAFSGETVFLAEIVSFDETSGETVVEVSPRSSEKRPDPEKTLLLNPPDFLSALDDFAESIALNPSGNPETRFMQLADTLGKGPLRTPDRFQDDFLRDSQADAVGVAQQNPFIFIWGPPGTGKSYTLGHLAAEWRMARKKVLVIAHTNAAVDVTTFAIDNACNARGVPLRDTELIRYTRHLTNLAEYKKRPHLLAFTNHLNDLLAKESVLRESRANLQRKLAGLTEEDEARKELSLKIGEIERTIANLGESRQSEVKRLLSEASIVCVSMTSCLFGNLLGQFHFDAVMIDEASLIPLAVWPWLLHPWACTRSPQFAVAGDPMQLQPIFKRRRISLDENDAVKKWFESNIYAYLGIVSMDSAEGLMKAGTLMFLREQFRMAHGIREAVSRAFYGGHLLGDRSDPIPVWPEGSGVPNGSVIAIDPAMCVSLPEAKRVRGVTGKNTNADAIVVTLTIIRRIIAAMASRKDETVSVLVLTPFRNQAHEYEKRLTAMAKPKQVTLSASTVHKAQGSEADVVIFDLVEPENWFVNKPASASLWCVACSRAKSQLMMIGSESAMREGRFSRRFVGDLPFTRLA